MLVVICLLFFVLMFVRMIVVFFDVKRCVFVLFSFFDVFVIKVIFFFILFIVDCFFYLILLFVFLFCYVWMLGCKVFGLLLV